MKQPFNRSLKITTVGFLLELLTQYLVSMQKEDEVLLLQ